MTRPIYEPSLTRKDAELGFGNDQLFRRPAPKTSFIPPWVALSEGATTVADNTSIPIPFADLTYDPNLVTQGVVFDWTITDAGDPGNDRYVLQTLVKGWFEWELITSWDEVATAGANDLGYAVQTITFDSVAGFPFDDVILKTSADWLATTYLEGLFEMLENPWLRGTGRIYMPGSRTWQLTAKQTTGSSRGFSGVLFRLWFMGADDAANWTFDTV